MLETIKKRIKEVEDSNITFEKYFQLYIMKLQDYNIGWEATDLARKKYNYVIKIHS